MKSTIQIVLKEHDSDATRLMDILRREGTEEVPEGGSVMKGLYSHVETEELWDEARRQLREADPEWERTQAHLSEARALLREALDRMGHSDAEVPYTFRSKVCAFLAQGTHR